MCDSGSVEKKTIKKQMTIGTVLGNNLEMTRVCQVGNAGSLQIFFDVLLLLTDLV